jgi:hypothetical protein
MVAAVEPSMSTDTVFVPETENGFEANVFEPLFTQNGRPIEPPLLELEELPELDDELLLEDELELLLDDELELEELLEEELLLDEDEELELELDVPVATLMPYKQ